MKKSTVILVSTLVAAASLAACSGSNSAASLLRVGGSGRLIHRRSGSGFVRSGASLSRHSASGLNTPSPLSKRLGITDDQIRTELKSGKTIQQIATEHGVTLPDPLQQLADRLKISKAELQSELKAGKPLMQILKDHGLQVPEAPKK